MKNENKRIADEEEYYSLTEKVWNVLAPYYDVIIFPFSRIRDKVVSFTNAKYGAKILDVATGTGKQAFAFAKRGYDVTGVDLSEAMLNIAVKKNRCATVKFQLADATHLPFADNSFDVTCVSFALHDMPLMIMEKVLTEMVRITKTEGIIVVVDYGLPKNRFGRFFIYHFVKLYEKYYYSNFIKSDLRALLRKSKIEKVKDRNRSPNTGSVRRRKNPQGNKKGGET